MTDIFAVILAGGKGERFWPLSTARRPKQFLALAGDKPLLSMAVDRLAGLIPTERVLVITSADLAGAAREAAPQVPAANVIGEPFGRDTAAACALGGALVKARSPGAVFCILTADQIMGNVELYQETLRQSFALAASRDSLLTIGIKPAFPSTGFGYIESAEPVAENNGIQFLKVKRFVEKPDPRTAEQFVAAGRYYWNSGMFIWSVNAFESALARHCPALHAMARRLAPAVGTPSFESTLRAEYERIGRISVDYALMEKADNIVMARGTFPWDDVGSWTALGNHIPADASGNAVLGACEALESKGNVVVSENRLTALFGVEDLVVVHAEHATLICPKSRAQEIKKLVQKLGENPEYRQLL